MELSCTSVMLPRWSLDETFDKLAELGFDALELRCRYNPDDPDAAPSFWGRHVADISPDNVVERAAEIRAASARTGIRVAALAPSVRVDDTEVIEKLFAGAVAVDPDRPPMVRIGAPAYDRTQPYQPQFLYARSRFAALSEAARPHGVRVLYEIHVGTIAVTASRAYELLRDLDPAHIGAIYDVPNMVRTGLEDTRMGIDLLGPYLAHCHIGNGVPVAGERAADGSTPWAWQFASLQDGVADIAQVVADLTDAGYTGCLSLEDFAPGEDAEKLASQSAYLRQCLQV
jgi:sugar phosphate isomerase/epimerase